MDSITKKREYMREYRKKNKERINERHRAWMFANADKVKEWAIKSVESIKRWRSDNKDAVHEHQKKWRELHPEKVKENRLKNKDKLSDWAKNNNEQVRANHRRWSAKNKEKVRLNAKTQQYRRKGAEGKFTASEWQDLCDKYDNRCLSCGEQKELTVDHVVSLKDGGSNTIDNLQPLCRSCNSRKGAKFIDYRT